MSDGASNASHRVSLRAVDASDLDALFRQQLDPEANAMAVVTARGAEAFRAHWEKIFGDPSVVARVVLVDGEVAGQVSCFKMDGRDSVGFWIAREHWGRGVATRALGLLLDEVSIRPLHARAARGNVGSIRVLERCGFVVTGDQRSPGDERFGECEEAMLTLL